MAETSNIVEKDVFISNYTLSIRRFLKINIVVLQGDLKAKVGFDNTLLGHLMGKHRLDDRYDNGGRYAI